MPRLRQNGQEKTAPAPTWGVGADIIEGFKAKNIEKYKMNPRPLSELHDEIMLEMKEYLKMCRFGICVR